MLMDEYSVCFEYPRHVSIGLLDSCLWFHRAARGHSSDDTATGAIIAPQVGGSGRRDLGRLSVKVAPAMVEFISDPGAEDPQRLSKHLRGELAAYGSARRGDYRALFRIDDDRRALVVVAINPPGPHLTPARRASVR
jgi:mRNA interferase RelE/StbE